ncbi:hypothetical protein ABZT28_55605 [Streptomyces sp. NPDC005388]|uniref:hypothetical protein n=1 Tax=Streptomyces sp. NPDC005388 TaxID=3156717 RepID=UPI0033B0B19F
MERQERNIQPADHVVAEGHGTALQRGPVFVRVREEGGRREGPPHFEELTVGEVVQAHVLAKSRQDQGTSARYVGVDLL